MASLQTTYHYQSLPTTETTPPSPLPLRSTSSPTQPISWDTVNLDYISLTQQSTEDDATLRHYLQSVGMKQTLLSTVPKGMLFTPKKTVI